MAETWLKQTFPGNSLRDYVERVAAFACEDAGVPMPSIVYYTGWTPDAERLCAIPVEALGYAQRGRNTIALDADLNLDQITHVIAHEVKHLAGERDEAACCAFARSFTDRRFMDILHALGAAKIEFRPVRFSDRRCRCTEAA